MSAADDEKDLDLEAIKQEMDLAEINEDVQKLLDAGAEWNNDTRTFSLNGKFYDEHGQLL